MLRADDAPSRARGEVLRMTFAPTSRVASAEDIARISALLEASELPTSDLADSRPEFVVVEDGSTLLGVGGLERFGDVALLRSLAVTQARRGSGIGGDLVRELERLARERGVREIILLTQTAEPFFASRGYRTIARDGLPPALLATAQFRTLCPASASCMSKRI
jgi:N-acetylglutamate synthase-like GNAT family acetyltransferase